MFECTVTKTDGVDAGSDCALKDIHKDFLKFWEKYIEYVYKVYRGKRPASFTIEIWPGRLIVIENEEEGEYFLREERCYGQVNFDSLEEYYSGDGGLVQKDKANALRNLVKFIETMVGQAVKSSSGKFWGKYKEEFEIMIMPFDSKPNARLFKPD